MSDSRFRVGYTAGVYDLFHIGHLTLLKNAKGLCDKLIVGVTVDELVSYKNKRAVIPFEERLEIVRSIKYVDAAIPQYDMDKFEMWNKLSFDVMFVGDDWYRSDKWVQLEEKFNDVGVRVVYFPYTPGTSSTIINQTLRDLRSDGTLDAETPGDEE
jgi:glycerol-3-phosphate cytidylyltransferase